MTVTMIGYRAMIKWSSTLLKQLRANRKNKRRLSSDYLGTKLYGKRKRRHRAQRD